MIHYGNRPAGRSTDQHISEIQVLNNAPQVIKQTGVVLFLAYDMQIINRMPRAIEDAFERVCYQGVVKDPTVWQVSVKVEIRY